MFPPRLIRSLAVVVAVLPAAACQATGAGADDPQLAVLRAAPPPPGGSGQRLDQNGYPLLGHYPRAATTQLTDAEVRAQQQRLNSVAARRSVSRPGATDRQYRAEVARLTRVRETQARALAAAVKKRPNPQAGAAAKAPTSPDAVLRQIESSH
ncbi:hypothetical protein [Jiella sp. M17.18]|uniref:hypothetical protein n=1 Tax=Jiella sp. M17.18 TaxID=3234247 RepID=UPI0034DE56CA